MTGSAGEIYDYVVVGSGAGGGTVAARLAEAGYSVVVLEAGDDPAAMNGAPGLPDQCEVPAFHPFASENPAIAWDFFVRHYQNQKQAKLDSKYVSHWDGQPVDGIFYPRASCLGGCTSHNAMIFIAPPDSDWDAIAHATKDPSWRAANMARYFARLENCHHRFLPRLFSALGLGQTGHGWSGWLRTERSLPREALDDGEIVRTLANAALDVIETSRYWRRSLRVLLRSFGDPNDRTVLKHGSEGMFYTPLSTAHHRRNGTRERIKQAERRWRLRVETGAMVTRVLLDERNRAVGVEFLKGMRLYRAHRSPGTSCKHVRRFLARREVIFAAGVFNTSQLLMLSGIGGKDELARFGIPCRVDLPGVGCNLQDRYEASVVYRMKEVWPSLRKAEYRRGDPLWQQWWRWRRGMYTSNGAALCLARKSSSHRHGPPDLFLMSLLAHFRGYFPGYAGEIRNKRNYLTWCILKAYTANRAGVVKLRSPDPAQPPEIDFNYFHTDPGRADLKAVVEGIHTVRKLMAPLLESRMVDAEEIPGKEIQGAELEHFVRNNAWGHHACGTCAIGDRSDGGVLNSDFQVHGVTGLRVVDASVFPRIPGYFIASAIYMIAEKAADAIIAAAAIGIPSPRVAELVPGAYDSRAGLVAAE